MSLIKSSKLDPEYHWAYLSKIIGQIQIGDLSGARRTLDDAPDRNVIDMAWAKFYIEYMDRNFIEAIDYTKSSPIRIISVHSVYVPMSLLAAMAYRCMGDYENASMEFKNSLEVLENALEENPDDSRILSSMGLVYAGLGNRGQAVSYGKKALELYPASKDPIVGADRLKDMAYIYAAFGECAATVSLLKEILDLPCWHTLMMFQLDPWFDQIRDHSCYKEFIQEYETR
jgi:tetratricopeptide (TPR) repeat protein